MLIFSQIGDPGVSPFPQDGVANTKSLPLPLTTIFPTLIPWETVSTASWPTSWMMFSSFFFKFIYSWETYRERQRHRQREKQAPHKEPDVGLNLRSRDHTLSQRQILTAEPPRCPGNGSFKSSGFVSPVQIITKETRQINQQTLSP